MSNEEIKTLADGYYAGNADWLNKEQEQDTKVGWRQGFAYSLRQFAVSGSLPCGCLKCLPNLFPNMRFNVCPICGNKRCPHASDHNYGCKNSNDVGQTGSVYGGNDR